ncbi:MAG: rhamnulokinase [Candidatus Omnitrophica bacterium]|nr:rhamnulokinase [Candidatus Omnitrophota bacterium]
MNQIYLAFDLGAESGRALAGIFSDGKLKLEEIHRFENRPVHLRGTLHWDFPRIFSEILEALGKFIRRYNTPPAGVSCDSWGVDFGLIDSRGHLLGNPVHYRDKRTEGMSDLVFQKVPEEKIYGITGLQLLKFDTLFQVESLDSANDPQWGAASQFLTIADLVHYHLCGAQVIESSLASTTHLYDATQRDWARDLIQELGYDIEKFPEVVPSGTRIGTIDEEVAEVLRLEPRFRNFPIIASLSHDTGAAVAAVPAEKGSKWAYLSSGTWSLLGIEIPEPILSEEARKEDFTNEGGAEGTVRFLKNIMGLWILQECRRTWEAGGNSVGYSEIAGLAGEAEPFASLIHPDDPRFFAPGDMVGRIQVYCKETNQPIPKEIGEIARCILESLALRYRQVLEKIESLNGGETIEVLHIVGGGGKNELLNQMIADVLGIPVLVGPTEATASGNLVTQAVAMNEVEDLWAGREIIKRSFEIREFKPDGDEDWDAAYERFLKLVG